MPVYAAGHRAGPSQPTQDRMDLRIITRRGRDFRTGIYSVMIWVPFKKKKIMEGDNLKNRYKTEDIKHGPKYYPTLWLEKDTFE